MPLSEQRQKGLTTQSASKRLRIAKHQAAARSPAATRRTVKASDLAPKPSGSMWERNERAALHTTEAILYSRMTPDRHLESALGYDDFDLISGKMRGRKNKTGSKMTKADARVCKQTLSSAVVLPSVSSLLETAANFEADVDVDEILPTACPLRPAVRSSKQKLHILTKYRHSERREKQLALSL